ncbi:hypothetical protein ACTA71_010762 [Dictyostelium dimigraforme]
MITGSYSIDNYGGGDPSPKLTPFSTNKPQHCIGNPVFGGSKQGYCREDAGCICFSPNPGNVNSDHQTTVIENSNSNSGNVNSDHQVTGNISIMAIREVNSITGEQVKIHFIDKYKEFGDTTTDSSNYIKLQVSSNTDSYSPNTICSTSSTSLTKGLLIGIIIGSSLFFMALVLILGKIIFTKSFVIFKKSKNPYK